MCYTVAMEWIVVAVICGLIGAPIGKSFDRLWFGIFLGALFGPVGWLTVLIVGMLSERDRRGAVALEPVRVPCPMCLEPVVKGAKICPHCRSAIEWPKEPKRVVKLGGVVIKRRRLVIRPKR